MSLLNHTLAFLLDSEDLDVEATSLVNRGKDCKTRSGRLVSCVDLQFCVGYGGLAVPEEIGNGRWSMLFAVRTALKQIERTMMRKLHIKWRDRLQISVKRKQQELHREE